MTPKPVQPIDVWLAETAARQHGLVAVWQVTAAGYHRELVKTRARSARVHRVHQGVYAVGHRLLSPEGRWLAAVLALGPLAVLSYRSAAALWGLANLGGARIDVTVPGRGTLRRPGIAIHHAGVERTVRRGVPVTTVARTLLDLAAVAPRRTIDHAVEVAIRERLFDLGEIDALPHAGHHGSGRLRRAIAAWDGAPRRSDLERRFLALCRERRLPRPAVNVVVAGYECDFVWQSQRLVVEVDGTRWHATAQAQARDRGKEAVLVLAGYRVHRFVWRQVVRTPEEVSATLAVLLAG